MPLPTPMRLSLIVLAVVFAGARAAEACSAVLTPVTTVIARSEAIARVRVLGQVPGGEPPGRVALEVVEVLKGRLGDRVLIVTGRLTAPRAPASRQPPYDQLDCARAGGCGGCFAHDYVPGREYLVLLKGGTPYWAPLAPANEEVSGSGDPWVAWVREQLRRP